MPAFKVVKFPAPVLKKESKPIALIRPEEKKLVDDMLETMYVNQGIGLAAPQVGILNRAIVIDAGQGPLQLINPIIVKKTGREIGEEGCLSLPGITLRVKRSKRIMYKGLNRDGKLVEDEAEGLLARAIQHEIDHLDGILIIDYANPVKRFFLKRKLLKKIQP